MPNANPAAYAVDVSRSPATVLTPVPVAAVSLAGEFWGPRVQRNLATTLPTQYALLESTGRLNNFRRVTGDCSDPYAGIFFNDSDVYKWIDAASWAQAKGPVPALQTCIDEAITLIEAAQDVDGYINTYFSVERKGQRWTDLRDLHEMYCGGHLIQAAVAHHRATGSTRLLTVACRFADLLCTLFGPADQGKRVAVDGHEEIEMALVELWRETGHARYLAQARFFIDARGQGLLHSGRWGLEYFQDHVPYRQMQQLCGHAVRALYMVCGVTDVVLETGDAELLALLESQWTHLTTRRMYITGGLGARHDGESLGKDFELPNARAYTETCAAIGSMMWCHRMLAATGKARYADLIEWTLYNGMLPGWSLDGSHYFYVNPLEDDGSHHRQAWYDVACCPPNVARTLAELPGYVYSTRADQIWVNLYIEGTAHIPLGTHTIHLAQHTRYPWDGTVEITVETAGSFSLQLRIPGWCTEGASLQVNGDPVDISAVAANYVPLQRHWQAGDVVQLVLPMPVRQWESHPEVHENAGRMAISRGPVLYCLEAVDHPGADINSLVLDAHTPLTPVFDATLLGGAVLLKGQAQHVAKAHGWGSSLYQAVDPDAQATPTPVAVQAIPYFLWQNRGPSQMAVWVKRQYRCC